MMGIYQIIKDKGIKKGTTFKNYSELCNILELPVEAGNSKISQLNNLKRYLSYKQDGHKFIVTRIFSQIKEKNDKRKEGNHVVYVKCIEALLLNYFIKNKSRNCYLSRSELFNILGMVNKNYIKKEHDKNFVYYMQQIDPQTKQWHIDHFYMRTRRKLGSIIKQSLNSLEKRGLIFYSEVVIAYRDGQYIVADKEEDLIPQILKCERKVLLEMGYESFLDLISNCKRSIYGEYIQKRNETLKKELNIEYVFIKYKISVCDSEEFLIGAYINDMEEIKRELNLKIINAVNEQAETEYDVNIMKYMNGKTKYALPDCYVPVQKLLANELLDINTNEISDYEIPLIAQEDLKIFD